MVDHIYPVLLCIVPASKMKRGTQMHYCALPELFSALSRVTGEIQLSLFKTTNASASLKEELDKVERLRALVHKQLEKLGTSAEYQYEYQ